MKLRFLLGMLAMITFVACGSEKTDSGNDNAGNETTNNENNEASKGGSYAVDAGATKVMWTGAKTEEPDVHKGEVKVTSGSLETDADGNPTGGNFKIDMLSIVNTDAMPDEMKAKLEGHLKSADFFDVEKYTTSTFTISGVKALENPGTYELTGALDVKELNNEISFEAKIDMDGNALKGTAEVALTPEQLGFPGFPATITINIELVANKA